MTGIEIVPKRFLGSGFIGSLFVVLAVIGGCSYVPDAVNPAEWYKSAKNVLTGNDNASQPAQNANGDTSGPAANRGKPAPGADKPFPSLSSVPNGLAADNRKRRYAADIVRFQGKAERSLSDEKNTAVASVTQPPLPTMPVTPVTPVMPVTPAPLSASVTAPVAPLADAQSSPAFAGLPKRVPSIPVSTMSAHSEGLSEFAPATSGGVEETFQARISQSRPLRMDNQLVASASSRQPPPAGPKELGTVVVSSAGLRNERRVTNQAGVTETTAPPPVAPDAAPLTASDKEPLMGSIKVATIQFPNGSAILDDSSRRVLVDASRIIRSGGGRVRVLGYASSRTKSMDPIRHKMVNYRVSVDRADRVARELIRLGVPAKDVTVDARSDSTPIYYESMPSGEAGNRRAEIFIER